MKKYFALIISMLVIITCFTACKPKLKGGNYITNAAGDGYAAVTKEDGGIVRDGAGNLIVLVTDENGKNVKDKNGEYQTNAVALEHALVIGDRIECRDFAIQIPSGWEDSLSFSDLVIKKTGTEDIIKISSTRDASLSTIIDDTNSSLLNTIKAQFDNEVSENKGITIKDIEAHFLSVFVPDNGTGTSSYLGYIFFENNGIVYTCMLTSNRDLSSQLDEITNILGTIEF